MSEIIQLSQDEARRFLLSRALLFAKESSVTAVVRHLSCLQVDPIRVQFKNHEWILHNRMSFFKSSDLDTELYSNRSLFEYWMQLFSIIPMENFPYMHARMQAADPWRSKYYNEHKNQLDYLLRFIQDNGPTSSKDIAHVNVGKTYFSWTNASSRVALFEFLWDSGAIMIHHRKNNMKVYDITERIVPPELLAKQVTPEESALFYLYKNFDYLGFLRKPFLRRVGYSRKLGLSELFQQEFETGNIKQVKIGNSSMKYFVRKSDLPSIEKASIPDEHLPIYLSPLDPLTIDRQLLLDVFNFHYRWEVYTPPAKRKFGYYGMPILENGRIERQIDAATKRIVIQR
jgi:uncharacterized protein YcaQ